MNVGYVLANSAARFPHKEAIVCDQGRMTFAMFENRAAFVDEQDRLLGAGAVGNWSVKNPTSCRATTTSLKRPPRPMRPEWKPDNFKGGKS